MNIEREQKYIKKINALADWKEYCLLLIFSSKSFINLLINTRFIYTGLTISFLTSK
jgi:hypothetical protein